MIIYSECLVVCFQPGDTFGAAKPAKSGVDEVLKAGSNGEECLCSSHGLLVHRTYLQDVLRLWRLHPRHYRVISNMYSQCYTKLIALS